MLLITFILLIILIKELSGRKIGDAYLLAIISFTSICFLLNEIFSVRCWLNEKILTTVYWVLCILIIFVIIRRKSIWSISIRKKLLTQTIDKRSWWIYAVSFTFLFGIFILAITTVPYNWDSMTYHLPRITQWAQNQSVAHYATHDIRQLTSPVLAEFINLHVYILSENKDNLLNMLQYTSFVTNSVLVYAITKKLDVDNKWSYISWLLFVSMPIAFGEAVSTQVDHFSTLWLLIFVYFILDLLKNKESLSVTKENGFMVITLSCCIAYGYLAKPSVLFAMLFFAIWLLIASIRRRDKIKDVLCLLFLSLLIMGVILTPEILRNLRTFGSVSAPVAGARQLVGTLKPHYLLVNGLKNFSMNLSNEYINWGGIIEHGIHWVAYILGVNIDDSAIAEDGVQYFFPAAPKYGHDTALNPVLMIAFIIAILWFVVHAWKKRKIDYRDVYVLVVTCSYLIFCLLLRWEPYVTRYMLSYLALLCPVIPLCLANIQRRKIAEYAVVILCFVSALEMIAMFQYHYDITKWQKGREEGISKYFAVCEGAQQYEQLEEFIRNAEYDTLGIYVRVGTYEYPIWTIEGNHHLDPVFVDNESIIYADKTFIPEAIVSLNRLDWDKLEENDYVCVYQVDDRYSIWELRE